MTCPLAHYLGNDRGRDATFLPGAFTSKNFKKGVYYNPYFTNDNRDSEGWLIFSIIILLQYNIASKNIIPKKEQLLTHLGLKNDLLRDWKFWFLEETSQQYKK